MIWDISFFFKLHNNGNEKILPIMKNQLPLTAAVISGLSKWMDRVRRIDPRYDIFRLLAFGRTPIFFLRKRCSEWWM